jgi:hypothetical protein
LRRRREVSGLQLPSYEACLAPSLRWNACGLGLCKRNTRIVSGSFFWLWDIFLSVVGRFFCHNGKMWDFGNKLDPGFKGIIFGGC